MGPIELWALNTTAEDVNIRNQLYKKIGPKEARRILAQLFSAGTVVKALEDRYADYKEEGQLLDDSAKTSVMQELIQEILQEYYGVDEKPVRKTVNEVKQPYRIE